MLHGKLKQISRRRCFAGFHLLESHEFRHNYALARRRIGYKDRQSRGLRLDRNHTEPLAPGGKKQDIAREHELLDVFADPGKLDAPVQSSRTDASFEDWNSGARSPGKKHAYA